MASYANLKLAELAEIKMKTLESAAKQLEKDNTFASSGASNKQTAHRPMLGYKTNYGISVLKKLKPGTTVSGYCTCFSAPACCPLISRICFCCGDSEYVQLKREASKYFHIRENSIEWNDPRVVLVDGPCCGVDPCLFDMQDNIKVLYYDDLVFNQVTDRTRSCNECRTCLFGGAGERIRLQRSCCCNVCIRNTGGCCIYLPKCCPAEFCPHMLRYEIYLEDAQKALYDIKCVRDKAIHHPFYTSSSNKK